LSFTAASNAAPKVVRITDVQPLKADTESTRRNLGGAALHRDDRIVWVHDHRNPCGSRHCFLQKRQTLLGKIQEHEANACHVAAWPGQVCDKARRNRISDLDHDNAVGEPSLSDEVPSLFPAEVTESLPEGLPGGGAGLAGLGSQHSDPQRLARLLSLAASGDKTRPPGRTTTSPISRMGTSKARSWA
jgi:hypothetical protein